MEPTETQTETKMEPTETKPETPQAASSEANEANGAVEAQAPAKADGGVAETSGEQINPRLNTGFNTAEQQRERGAGAGAGAGGGGGASGGGTYRYARGGGRDRPSRPRSRVYFRKRIDKIKAYNLRIDYKDPDNLRRFISDKGKILPRRITGTSAKNQRHLVRQIKRARFLALLPMG